MTTAQDGPESTIDGLNVQTHQAAEIVKRQTFSIGPVGQNICLCSAFRDSVPYLDRYLGQVTELYRLLTQRGDRLHCVWGEGDSEDGTYRELSATWYAWDTTIVDCTHGGKSYDSVVREERFRQLAHVGRCIFAAIPADSDVVVYVESDIAWDAKTMMGLIDRLSEYPAISPMILLQRGGWASNSFYDTYVFRKDGRQFGHHPPYHSCYRPDRPFPVDSAGSCMAMRGEIARRLIFDEQTIFPDLCRQIYAGGASVWVDPRLCVIHH